MKKIKIKTNLRQKGERKMKITLILTIAIFLIAGVSWGQESNINIGESDADIEMFKKNSNGVGFGIPYGIIGINTDINLAQNLNLSVGIGTTIFAGMGYNFGLKYYLLPVNHTFRPRISAYYGTNAIVLIETGGWASNEEGESYKGVTLGIGSQWMWGESKSNGMDIDIMYIASSGLDIDELRRDGYNIEDPGNIKLSIGYRHGF